MNGESRTPTPHAPAWLIRGGEDSPAHCYLCRTEADVEAALTELLGGDSAHYLKKFRDPDEWAGCELKWKDWEIGYVAITSFPASLLAPVSETGTPDQFTLQCAEELFGCHFSPAGRGEFICAICETPINVLHWVTAKHADDCFINQVRDYLAKHKPECVPGVEAK